MLATTAQISMVKATAIKAGIEWPDELEDELTAADDFQQSALPDPDRQAVARAIHDAISDGTDPAEDPAVRDALTRYQLATAAPPATLREVATRQRHDALVRHADELYRRLADAVADADATIDAARQSVPGLDPFDNDQVARLRPEPAAAWVRARDACLVVEKAAQCWGLLATATGGAKTGGGRFGNVLRLADLHAPDLDAITTARPSLSDLVTAGHRLSLATPDEFRRRVARLQDEREGQARQREADFQTAYRKSHGAGQSIVI